MTIQNRAACSLASALAIIISTAAPSSADEVSDFYRGKTVEFLVGAAAGGGFDLTARPLAPFLAKHLPGSPNIIIRNMPGGAGVIMTNYLAGAAPSDGSVIGMGTSNVPYEPRLNTLSPDGRNIKYDPQKLGWIGTPGREPQVSYVWHATGVTKWQDLRTAKIRFGATAVSGDNAIFPALANQLLGLKSEIITGYRGVTEILLAMERGELEASNSAYSTLTISKPDWKRDNKARVIMQFGLQRLEAIKDVPTIMELVDNPDDQRMLRFFLLKFEMHRPIYAPAGVPPARLAALRTAFDKAVVDPEFLAMANRLGLDINPLNGAGVAKLVDEIMATPQPVVDRLKKTLETLSVK